MTEIEEVTIKLKGSQEYYNKVEVFLKKTNKELTKRTVSVSSLLSAFDKSLVRDAPYISIGKMPFGYYDSNIKIQNEKLCANVITIITEGKQIMTYEKTRFDICTPSILFFFQIVEERLQSTKVFAIKDKIVKDTSKIYTYPFGNVSLYDGRVCWGLNQLKKIKKLKDLEEIMTLFINSPCNSDHYDGKLCCGQDITLRQLFEGLKTLDKFPDSYLMPKNDLYKQVGDLLKNK